MHRIGLQTFRHVHSLDIDYHLNRRTGGLARDIERGTNGISFLLRFFIFNIAPTLFEIAMVAILLLYQLRRRIRRGDCGVGVFVRQLFVSGYALAHAVRARGERRGLRQQHPRGRQPAQLRDREIL